MKVKVKLRMLRAVQRLEQTLVRNAIGAGLALLGIFASGLAIGQEAWTVNPGLTDGFTLEIGAYAPTVKTTARFDSTLGPGTSISFEDDLGLDDRKTQVTVLGKLRLGQRWRIEGEYFALNRSGTRVINKTINWGGNTYPIGIVVDSEFDSDIYRLSAGYSFIKSTRSGARRGARAARDGFHHVARRSQRGEENRRRTRTASDHWRLWVVRVNAPVAAVGAR